MSVESQVPPVPPGSGNPAAQVGVPAGLIDAVLHLVSTGPVPLGAYTLAEMVAVDAVVDFLDDPPSPTSLAEAVRSLAARQLLVAIPDSDQLQVRGDLGIALVFQQRARLVLDARVTGTPTGEPWRMLLLPQAEGITLEILIDALGVHQVSLRETEAALDRLLDHLPRGDPGLNSSELDDVLARAGRSALVSVTRYAAVGTAERAESSTDVVLAEAAGRLHVFLREPDEPVRLAARPLDRGGVRDLLAALAVVAAPPPQPTPDQLGAEAGPTQRRSVRASLARILPPRRSR